MVLLIDTMLDSDRKPHLLVTDTKLNLRIGKSEAYRGSGRGSVISISTTYKRANLAGKLNLDHPSASIKQSRFIYSPHPSLPQFTHPFHRESIAQGKKEGKLDCLPHDPNREHPVPFDATPLLPSTRF
jgi:hypothetical protein